MAQRFPEDDRVESILNAARLVLAADAGREHTVVRRPGEVVFDDAIANLRTRLEQLDEPTY